mmetsp:Transcript_22004/g.39433  ORF Transcript_22004/g.39433 Transcript_22004/m.39433 type:complete len:117 (+) Transcript_22004:757-1107(+)
MTVRALYGHHLDHMVTQPSAQSPASSSTPQRAAKMGRRVIAATCAPGALPQLTRPTDAGKRQQRVLRGIQIVEAGCPVKFVEQFLAGGLFREMIQIDSVIAKVLVGIALLAGDSTH